MVKNIKINLEAIEGMLYFWQAASDKENVSEMFFYDMSNMEGYKLIYDQEFNEESVRKVLSAIKNRELLSNATKKEKRYWNYNMWVMEDLEYTRFMADPVKKLNLDRVLEEIKDKESKYCEIEVIFAPLHMEDFYIRENKIIINFFKVKPDDLGNGAYLNNVKLEDFIKDTILKIS